MKHLKWDKTLSIQIDEIDDDHRKLVDLFNILGHAITDKESTDYIEAVLEELITCTVWHFRHEERLMIKHGYDRFADHKKEHNELIKSAKELQQKFRQQGKTLSDEDITYLEHWLTGHILSADMALGAYLSTEM